jgi:hypothetical protein
MRSVIGRLRWWGAVGLLIAGGALGYGAAQLLDEDEPSASPFSEGPSFTPPEKLGSEAQRPPSGGAGGKLAVP